MLESKSQNVLINLGFLGATLITCFGSLGVAVSISLRSLRVALTISLGKSEGLIVVSTTSPGMSNSCSYY